MFDMTRTRRPQKERLGLVPSFEPRRMLRRMLPRRCYLVFLFLFCRVVMPLDVFVSFVLVDDLRLPFPVVAALHIFAHISPFSLFHRPRRHLLLVSVHGSPVLPKQTAETARKGRRKDSQKDSQKDSKTADSQDRKTEQQNESDAAAEHQKHLICSLCERLNALDSFELPPLLQKSLVQDRS